MFNLSWGLSHLFLRRGDASPAPLAAARPVRRSRPELAFRVGISAPVSQCSFRSCHNIKNARALLLLLRPGLLLPLRSPLIPFPRGRVTLRSLASPFPAPRHSRWGSGPPRPLSHPPYARDSRQENKSREVKADSGRVLKVPCFNDLLMCLERLENRRILKVRQSALRPGWATSSCRELRRLWRAMQERESLLVLIRPNQPLQ